MLLVRSVFVVGVLRHVHGVLPMLAFPPFSASLMLMMMVVVVVVGVSFILRPLFRTARGEEGWRKGDVWAVICP